MRQLSNRRRGFVFALLTGAALAVAVAYVAWAALDNDAEPRARPTNSALKAATAQRPFLVYQHVARGEHYAEVAVVPLTSPDAAPTFTGLVCERVYFAARSGLCLMPKQEALGAAVRANVFGLDFRPLRSARLDGILSRARVSPSGRYGATTTFVSGHSYRDQGFSTNTSVLDMERGKVLADLEDFAVTKNGRRFDAIDFNFWGVTFTADDTRFYATLETAGDLYLVEGDVATKKARVVGEDVECPSLSPDGKRRDGKRRSRRRTASTIRSSGSTAPGSSTGSTATSGSCRPTARAALASSGRTRSRPRSSEPRSECRRSRRVRLRCRAPALPRRSERGRRDGLRRSGRGSVGCRRGCGRC